MVVWHMLVLLLCLLLQLITAVHHPSLGHFSPVPSSMIPHAKHLTPVRPISLLEHSHSSPKQKDGEGDGDGDLDQGKELISHDGDGDGDVIGDELSIEPGNDEEGKDFGLPVDEALPWDHNEEVVGLGVILDKISSPNSTDYDVRSSLWSMAKEFGLKSDFKFENEIGAASPNDYTTTLSEAAVLMSNSSDLMSQEFSLPARNAFAKATNLDSFVDNPKDWSVDGMTDRITVVEDVTKEFGALYKQLDDRIVGIALWVAKIKDLMSELQASRPFGDAQDIDKTGMFRNLGTVKLLGCPQNSSMFNDTIANDDEFTIEEDDDEQMLNVLSNDVALDGQTLRIVAVSQAQHGTTSLNLDHSIESGSSLYSTDSTSSSDGLTGSGSGSGSLSDDDDDDDDDERYDIYLQRILYTPDPHYHGEDSFSYSVTDWRGDTATGYVILNIEGENDEPIASDDTYYVTMGTEKSIHFRPLENDVDYDKEDDLVITRLSLNGIEDDSETVVTLNEDKKTLTFLPDQEIHSESIMYVVNDTIGAGSTATVTFVGVFNGIATNEDHYTLDEDSKAVKLWALDNDSPPSGVQLKPDMNYKLRANAGGHAEWKQTSETFDNDPLHTGWFIEYTPAVDFNGDEIITYKVTGDDNTGLDTTYEQSSIYITIEGTNDAPRAHDDEFTFDEDSGTHRLHILRNDVDVDGDLLEISNVGTPDRGGTVKIAGMGLMYTAVEHFFGEERFNYTVSDISGAKSTGFVTIKISGINDSPNATADLFTCFEDSGKKIFNPLTNDIDTEDDDLIITSVHDCTDDQTVSLSPDQLFLVYETPENFHGIFSCRYNITDGLAETTSSFTVIVNPINDDPIAYSDAISVVNNPDRDTKLDVLANDVDDDQDTLTIVSVGNSRKGRVTISDDGDYIIYTPSIGDEDEDVDSASGDGAAAYTARMKTGNDTIAYTIEDGHGGTSESEVTVSLFSADVITTVELVDDKGEALELDSNLRYRVSRESTYYFKVRLNTPAQDGSLSLHFAKLPDGVVADDTATVTIGEDLSSQVGIKITSDADLGKTQVIMSVSHGDELCSNYIPEKYLTLTPFLEVTDAAGDEITEALVQPTTSIVLEGADLEESEWSDELTIRLDGMVIHDGLSLKLSSQGLEFDPKEVQVDASERESEPFKVRAGLDAQARRPVIVVDISRVSESNTNILPEGSRLILTHSIYVDPVMPEIHMYGGSPAQEITESDEASYQSHTEFGTLDPTVELDGFNQRTRTFTVKNTGQGALWLQKLDFDGAAADFFSAGDLFYPVVIPTGGSQDIEVTFHSHSLTDTGSSAGGDLDEDESRMSATLKVIYLEAGEKATFEVDIVGTLASIGVPVLVGNDHVLATSEVSSSDSHENGAPGAGSGSGPDAGQGVEGQEPLQGGSNSGETAQSIQGQEGLSDASMSKSSPAVETFTLFGTNPVDHVVERRFLLENRGSADFNLNKKDITLSDFYLSEQPISSFVIDSVGPFVYDTEDDGEIIIQPGEYLPVVIKFSAAELQQYDAAFTIKANSPQSDDSTYHLSAETTDSLRSELVIFAQSVPSYAAYGEPNVPTPIAAPVLGAEYEIQSFAENDVSTIAYNWGDITGEDGIVDFGSVKIGKSAFVVLSIFNSGSNVISVEDVVVSSQNNEFSRDIANAGSLEYLIPLTDNILPNSVGQILLRFSPEGDAGSRTASVQILSSGTNCISNGCSYTLRASALDSDSNSNTASGLLQQMAHTGKQ